MASKNELRKQLKQARQDLAKRDEELGVATREREWAVHEIRTHERRESARMRREHEAEQSKRREAEHAARRETLDRLGEGLLSLKKRTRWAIVNEEGETGIEVFVPLDQEEQRIALGYLNGKPKTLAAPLPVPDWLRHGGFIPRPRLFADGIRVF